MSGDFLQQMAASSRQRARDARREQPEEALLERALATAPPPQLHCDTARFGLIAELKLRSPAAGQLRSAAEDVAARVATYARAGAGAVSVLTEPSRFDGSMLHLEKAAAALRPLHVPVMRKDFLVDPYQVTEARAAGAGGILVIIRMLAREQIEQLLEQARLLGLFVLLEAFDERDIEQLHQLADDRRPRPMLLAGVNCRDLATLQVVPGRLEQLAHLLPTGLVRVAESGVGSADDAARAAAAGYDLVLVGSALMQGEDPGALAGAMLAAGAAAHRIRRPGAA
jgi:indole-3-glycerol phosphate synthase